MFKRPKAQIIIGLMAAWFLISIYFYFQHLVTVKTDLLFEKMDFGDESIIITELRLDNYQRKPREAWDNLPWYYNTKIPHQILYRFSEAILFYSSPYTKYDDSGFLTVRGMKIGSIDNQEPHKSLDDFRERYNIRIADFEDQPFSRDSRSSATIENNANILHFQHDDVPVSDDIDTIKFVVTDNQTGLYQTLFLHPQWEEHKLSYFSRYSIYPSRNYEPGKTAKTFVNSILDEHRYISEKLLHPKCRKNIDWSILDHELWDSQREDCVLYEGSYQGFHDVFSYYMNFTNSDGADAPITASQKIYLLFQDDTWKVLDVSPLENVRQ
ncbi:hypothetical protein ASZ90_019070 [hydrocarbon metagenome]|uniref:Uncharacterized protein n=1 Tax=hydrocarbon metagenome TaxID=938273 RepID=A0A0W8E4E2_9ZZZZ